MITWTRRLIFTGSLLALLATNVLTLTSTAFNAALSGVFSKALGVQTVADLMSQRLATKEAALVRAQSTRASKQLAAKNFGRRLVSRTQRVAATSIASIAAESVPYLGISVILAATGYELYEACQSMKDLEELYGALEVEEASPSETIQLVCDPQLPDVSEVWNGVKAQSGEWINQLTP